jgi:hypothetical protein
MGSSDYIPKPSQYFRIRALDGKSKDQRFYLGSHLKPVYNSNETFQYYHRFTGNTNGNRHLAVDVDIQNRVWRVLSLSAPDLETKWLATGFNSKTLRLPKFSQINETGLWEGAFNTVNATRTERGKEAKSYLYIPDLEYAIADFSEFLNRCEYEPFLRVYDTQGMETKSIHELVTPGWTSKDESRSFKEVMRTASFGHGRHGLETCLHMESFRTKQIDDQWDTPSIVFPLAIISSMRLRMWEMKVRGFRC